MSKVQIKSAHQIAKMKIAGQALGQILKNLASEVKVGMSTLDIEELCLSYCAQWQVKASVKGYKGFPASVCTSVNNVACHGIPSKEVVLKDGDIINVDLVVNYEGWHADSSIMIHFDPCETRALELINAAEECLYKGIEQVKPYSSLFNIAKAISLQAQKRGFKVVDYFCGHGIGRNIHESPCIIHSLANDSLEEEYLRSYKLMPGMVFTIEPILTEGSNKVKILQDGWTAVTVDSGRAAYWEHTVLVTDTGVEILTDRA